MQQQRPPFMAALISFVSLLSLAFIASANAPNGPLNGHPYGDKHLGRGTLETPNSQRDFGKFNQGVARRAHHHRRSGDTGPAQHKQGQPAKAYGHHSGAIGNAYQNKKLPGKVYEQQSGGIENTDQGLVGSAYKNQSGSTENLHQNQGQELVGNAYENQSGSPGTAHQNQGQEPVGNAYENQSGSPETAHQNQGQELMGNAYENQSRGTENAQQNQNQNQGPVGKAYGNHLGGTEKGQQNQEQWQVGKAFGNNSEGTANQHQNEDQGQAGKEYSGGMANTQQNQTQLQVGKSNSSCDYGNGTEGTIASEALAGEFLLAHNLVRQKFNQPLYTWDNNLALYARTHASTLSHHCKMIHSDGRYGENIFWGLNLHWKPMEAVKFWFEEYKDYDFNTHTCATGKKCGHFTQMVWRDSVRLGCAAHICRQGTGMLMICEYDPPGNYENENPFDNNNAKQ